MKNYSYRITLDVEVEAFDESDAWSAIQEVIGTGDMGGGVTIVDCEYKELDV